MDGRTLCMEAQASKHLAPPDGRREPMAGALSRRRPAITPASGRQIGPGQPCFLVAEVGQNHNGDLALARRLIDGVAGYADAVKFCKRHIPSDLTREAYERPYPGRHSFGPTYGKHREALELTIEQYAQLKQYAEARGQIGRAHV